MTRNPNWTVDELILSLDLFFRVNPLHTSENNPEIIKLSNILNSLPIHPTNDVQEKFRNPTGVYMKLCNFLRFDESYHGKGLTSGSKLDKVVWDTYSNDRDKLRKTVKSILDNYQNLSPPRNSIDELELIDEDEEFLEGKILTRIHKRKERNKTLIKKKKKSVLQKLGKLECEVCSFNFGNFYGEIGEGYIECHHTVPISELQDKQTTKISDLSLVCSNCHKIIHRQKPLMSISEIKGIVNL